MPPRKRRRTRFLSKSELSAAKALSRFKPRKKDRLSFVHVGLNGKPLPKGSNKKGVFVYVNKKGKFSPVRERPRQKVVPRKAAGFDLPSTRRKTALQKWYQGKSTYTRAVRSTRMLPKEKKSGVNFLRFSRKLASDLRTVALTFRSRGTFLIDLAIMVKLPSGATETYLETVQFNQHELQSLTLSQIEKFVRTKVYAFIAENLKTHGLVSAGSAAHIRNLSANRGQSRGDWVDRQGQPWEKADLDVVKILRIDYQLKRIGK